MICHSILCILKKINKDIPLFLMFKIRRVLSYEELDMYGIRYVWYIINYIKSVYNTKQLFPWTNSGECNFVTKPLVICFEKHHYLFE